MEAQVHECMREGRLSDTLSKGMFDWLIFTQCTENSWRLENSGSTPFSVEGSSFPAVVFVDFFMCATCSP